MDEPNTLHTIAELADQWRERPQRLAYLIRRDRIKPVKRVGLVGLYSSAQAAAIKQALFEIRIQK